MQAAIGYELSEKIKRVEVINHLVPELNAWL
jgi:hypothetical protein